MFSFPALNINLEIGEIVQSLDIKTMAEQWKAYTMICEKHSNFLSDKMIFQDCCKVLSNITVKNITIAIEVHIYTFCFWCSFCQLFKG